MALILCALETIFFDAIRLPYTGLATLTSIELLTHLYSGYATISLTDITANDSKIKAPFDINMPIEGLYQRIQECVEYAAEGNTLYTPEQVLAIAYQHVYQTGLFVDDCKA